MNSIAKRVRSKAGIVHAVFLFAALTGLAAHPVPSRSILDQERYDDPSGLRGESSSTYDAEGKRWHQTWVTNRGQLLTLEGQLRGGELVLVGDRHTSDGQEGRSRGPGGR